MIDKDAKSAVLGRIDGMRKEIIGLLVEAVKIQSINPLFPGIDSETVLGGENQVSKLFAEVEKGFGCKVDLFEKARLRTNCVSTMKGIGGGKSLILNGHIDTVPFFDLDGWKGGDPLSAKITRNGKLYGRGSADMKAGNVAMLKACDAIVAAGIRLKGDVFIEHVVGEETMSNDLGVSACIERGYRADAGIVTEPSAPPHHLGIIPMTPGAAWMTVTVTGKPVHVGVAGQIFRAGGQGDKLGVNAIDKGVKVYQALRELEQQWGITKQHPLFWPGQFVIMPGVISGSPVGLKAPFMTPNICTLDYCIMYHPYDAIDNLKAEIENFVYAAVETDPWLKEHPPKFQWRMNFPPSIVKQDHPIVRTLEAGHTLAKGGPAHYQSASYVADSTFMNMAGIPTVIFGPGSIEVAHAYNEFVEVADVIQATKSLALTIMEWCEYVRE